MWTSLDKDFKSTVKRDRRAKGNYGHRTKGNQGNNISSGEYKKETEVIKWD